MTQVATRETVIPRFDHLELESEGARFGLEWRDEEFWVELDDPEWGTRPGTPRRVEREIVQTTGSHHLQLFWMPLDPTGESRKLSLFPMVYRIEEQRWIPIDSVFLLPPDMKQPIGVGRWNTNCIGCHATGGEPRLGPASLTETGLTNFEQMDTRVAQFGIACEACHGPAAEHVGANRDPRRRYQYHQSGAPDPTIANPEQLPPRLSAQICGQCHAVSFPRPEFMDHWRQFGHAYRPGDDLNETREVATGPELQREPGLRDTWFWPDGVVRVSGREYNGLLETPCYTHGEEDHMVTCLSCHSMHPAADDDRPFSEWADDQLQPGMRTNEACTQCHEQLRGEVELASHTRHDVDSSGSNCYNCHMSYTSYGLLKAIRSHTVESPSVQTSLKTGRPNACNQCHLDRTLAWTAEHLQQRHGLEKPELSEDQGSIAASVLWTLKGDAGQRALMAWSMGWEAAREASGSDWMSPYLAFLMTDPYDAVRFIAYRSLRMDPAFADFDYDFLAPVPERRAAANRVLRAWRTNRINLSEHSGGARPMSQLLIDDHRLLPAFKRLVSQRDHRRVSLAE